MPEFLKRLVSPRQTAETPHTPKARSAVTGTIKVSHGKSFKVVREDILQKGLSRRKPQEVA